MARKVTPEGKLIELFDSGDVDRAEILLGLAKTLLKRKKKDAGQAKLDQVMKPEFARLGTA